MKIVPVFYSLFARCRMLMCGVLLIAVGPYFSGCGSEMEGLKPQGGAASDRSFIAPTNFIQQLAATDSIVVSNRFSGDFPTNENLSLKLAHKQVKRVLKAVSSLRASEANSGSLWDLQLQFFHGTNFLGRANFEGASVVIEGDDREYHDRTGILDKLYAEDSDQLLPSFLKKKKH
jgi:hypothetical protein